MVESSEPPGRYTVVGSSEATMQMQRLATRAKQLGMGPEVYNALTAIMA
jgi:hypothetical protein